MIGHATSVCPVFRRPLLSILLCLTQVCFAAEVDQTSRVLYEGRIPDGPALLVGEVSIDGKIHPLMVDTGVEAPLMADSSIASQYGEPVGETRIKYSDVKGLRHAIPAATVGGLKLSASVAPAFDLSSIRNSLGIPPFCILGWNAMKGRRLELDFDAAKFRLVEGSGEPPDNWTTLPVTIEHATPSIHAPIGDMDFSWAIDTGYDDTIMVSQANFARLVEKGYIRERSAGSITAIGGANMTRSGYFNKGSLLGVDLAGLNVTTEPRDFELLGMTFLRKLNFVISIDPSRFSYIVRKDPPIPIADKIMMGIIFTYDKGQGVIHRIRPGSNAEKLGLKPGDRVERIDELGDGPLNAFRMFELCRKHAEKTVTLHVLRDGQPLTVPLPLTATVDAWNRSPAPSK